MPVAVDVARDLAQALRLGVLAGLVGELPYVDVVRGGAADLDGARLPEDVERLFEVPSMVPTAPLLNFRTATPTSSASR